MIGRRRCGWLREQTLFRTIAAEIVERQVGGDPPRPSGEVSVRPELLVRPIDAPESLYGQILRDARIAHDAHNPGVNVALELPDQRLERIDLAKRKSPEQIHKLLYCLLRDRNEWVTNIFNAPAKSATIPKARWNKCSRGRGAVRSLQSGWSNEHVAR